jgi:hypothetical protein
MTLYQKTKLIVNQSIKSVVFIDEKAIEFYKGKPDLNIVEEKLSKNLYLKFKEIGISLAVHKFVPSNISNPTIIKYLLEDRDLVLLDWELGDYNGEQYSLALLSKVVMQKNIHFCSIYTSHPRHDIIIDKISAYFSGYTNDYYLRIIEGLNEYHEDNLGLFNRISRTKSELNQRMFQDFNELDSGLPRLIMSLTGGLKFGEALIQVSLAFSKYLKSPIINPKPSHVNKDSKTLNINNTIITILSKNEDSASRILNKISSQLSKSDNCFSQILGLDMQNYFSEQTSFIDKNLLDTSFETILFHRKSLINQGSEYDFELFIKDILQEQAKLTLNNAKLSVLESSFLTSESARSRKKIFDSELAILNTFYNGSRLKNKTNINFGDIFFNNISKQYYLCITALCDCLHPENIKNNFFFVTGEKVSDLRLALSTGDGNFKSYVDGETCIKWTKPADDWTKGDYIKPIQLHIPNSVINTDLISVQYLKDSTHLNVDLKYIFTLKSQYAQRIANHTFAHPVRVGVDFVKK